MERKNKNMPTSKIDFFTPFLGAVVASVSSFSFDGHLVPIIFAFIGGGASYLGKIAIRETYYKFKSKKEDDKK